MTADQTLATANLELDRLQARIEAHHEALADLNTNRDVSEEYRDRARGEQQEDHLQAIAAVRRRVDDLLTRTASEADAALAAPPSAADPTAAARVQAALATMAPADVADVLAEMGDLEGLRHLRRQVPLFVAARESEPMARARFTRQVLDTIDERLASAGGENERGALAARTGIEATRARLESLWDFNARPTGVRRMNLAYASPQGAA